MAAGMFAIWAVADKNSGMIAAGLILLRLWLLIVV
jgi:hypothetical protein